MSEPRFVIKICGVTSLEDASIAVEAGANAIGLNFYPKSARYIDAKRAREIAHAVAGACLCVGVFVDAGEAELREAAETIGLHAVQIHGTAPRFRAFERLRIWRAIAAGETPETKDGIEAFLVDAPCVSYGGSGQTFDWALAAKLKHRTIIAGGLDAANVAQAIEAAMPWGVDACSRLESSPGKKDAHRVRKFVAAAAAASRLVFQES